LKVRMAELTGLSPLARMYGSILQQFMPDEMTIRVVNEDGQREWMNITAESLQGGFDYDIEAESSTVTESVRKEQSMNLLQTFAQILDPTTGQPLVNLGSLRDDVLDAFGKKNKERYTPSPPPAPPAMGPEMGGAVPPGAEPQMDPNVLMQQLGIAPPQMAPEQVPQ